MQFIYPESEEVKAKPWTAAGPPEKILVIRLHALGDVIAIVPPVQLLKKLLPGTEFHLLTSDPNVGMMQNMAVFDRVHAVNITAVKHRNIRYSLKAAWRLFPERFDVVLDLQKNNYSRLIRNLLLPKAWSEYDRFSRISGIERYAHTIEALGLGPVGISGVPELRDETSGLHHLRNQGWDTGGRLILLNPCGLFPTRQWGTDKYLDFARLWLRQVDSRTRFLLLGLPAIREKTDFLKRELGPDCIDLVGQTSIVEALSIIRKTDLVLSDDGGLMHMSWTNGRPTLAFLGASPSYWCRPVGDKTFAFHSSDLSCGNCHLTTCIWGDNRCLARVSPQMAVEKARELLGV